jgi:hypothetical protein
MPEASALRVVLFGLPSAGKSALLGALTQAARVQETLLNGRLVTSPEALAELHTSFANDHLRPTSDDVTAYPLTLEPLSGGKPLVADLVDVSGRKAAEMVSGARPVRGWRSGALGKAIAAADALIVVTDASADIAHLQRDFGQLAAFLRLLEQSRGKRTDVSGLPVYLVLSKCDLLAKRTDTAADWLERVQERRRQVEAGFDKYLSQQPERAALAFGKLEYRVFATAARLPVLADRPGNPQEPYGVAELFRQCLHAAARFQEREDRSDDRLRVTITGAAGLIALMLLLAVAVHASRPSAEVAALENELHGILPSQDAAPAERLKEPLDKKLEHLHRIEKDPSYPQLPGDTRDEVAKYVQEVETYRKFNKDFLERVRDPRLATREEDLAKIEKQLADNPLPEEYAADWKDTRIGRRSQQWRNDIQILRAEVKKAEAWIHEQIGKGKELQDDGLELRKAPPETKKDWLERYRRYLERQWPHPPGTRPPGAIGVSYETVYRFDKVERARQVWDEFKRAKLGYVRQLLDEGS